MVAMTNSGVDKYSFPSGHSSRAIMTTNLLMFLLENIISDNLNFISIAILLNILSYTTCLSRLLLLRHFFSDILGGIIVGYVIYLFVIFLFI